MGLRRIILAFAVGAIALLVLYGMHQPARLLYGESDQPSDSATTLTVYTLNPLSTWQAHEEFTASFEEACRPALQEGGYSSAIEVVSGTPRNVALRDLLTGRFHVALVHSSVFGDLLRYKGTITDMAYEPIGFYRPYKAVVIVQNDSDIDDLEDLTGRRIACVNEDSYSGYKVPIWYLSGLDIIPHIVFSGGEDHTDIMRAVRLGQVDAGVTYANWAADLPKNDVAELRDIDIPIVIPGAVWLMRADVAADDTLRSSVESAVMSVAGRDASRYWSGLTLATPASTRQYVADIRRIALLAPSTWGNP